MRPSREVALEQARRDIARSEKANRIMIDALRETMREEPGTRRESLIATVMNRMSMSQVDPEDVLLMWAAAVLATAEQELAQ